MLEALLCITWLGFLLASRPSFGFANPFQIYFLVWGALFAGYYLSVDKFIPVSGEFIFLMLVAKSFALMLLLIAAFFQQKTLQPQQPLQTSLDIDGSRYSIVLAVQLAVIAALPLVYLRALSLSGGESIFTVLGYIKLRSALEEEREAGYGLLAYFSNASYVVSSIVLISYLQAKLRLGYLIISIAVSLFYAYLSTGRTFFLLFACLAVGPLVVSGHIKLRGAFIFTICLAGIFILIAAMTAKGVNAESGLSANTSSFFESLTAYTTAPFVAFSQLVSSEPTLAWGANMFRFFVSLQYKLGLSDVQPVPLIRSYVFVPAETNVYTVYDAYFRDYSYAGVFIPPALLGLHYWLYRKATTVGGLWIFYYSTSIYPLVMQFFQDQYFSLLSMWIQIAFMYWLLMRRPKHHSAVNKAHYA